MFFVDVSRQLIKEQQRGPLYRELMARRHEDTEYMRKVIVQEQQMLAKYLEQLKQKSKKWNILLRVHSIIETSNANWYISYAMYVWPRAHNLPRINYVSDWSFDCAKSV